ncbi:thermonuclease family protein [Solicola sp. PLA-1-18]|uniref:thermonuclease family protein n=1 Tax=Solicola sp. PLA-1-18 TaxID=3380532 RepID=UPI003B808382
MARTRGPSRAGIVLPLVLVAAVVVFAYDRLGGSDDDTTSTTVGVARVSDGDTFRTGDGERVRVLGIDTPEVGGDRGPQCGGAEATRAAERLLDGADVTLTGDPTQAERDRFGRRLAYVTLPDGRDLARVLLEQGWARVYAPAGAIGRMDEYRDAERAARDEGLGVWGRC